MSRCSPQGGLEDYPKIGVAVVLAHERHAIDCERLAAACMVERPLQRSKNLVATIRLNLAGQRHVKAKVGKQERVSPTLEVLDLSRVEPQSESLGSFLRRHRRAEAIEHRGAFRRQCAGRRLVSRWYDSRKATEHSDDRCNRRHRMTELGKALDGTDQLLLAAGRRQMEPRLQRRMKAIPTGLLSQPVPFSGGSSEISATPDGLARIAIVSKNGASELIEMALGRRHKIDGVARSLAHDPAS